jgi:hypothetical protein
MKLEEVAKKHKLAIDSADINGNAYTTVFARSGYSYSKRLQSLVVKNNAIRTMAVKSEANNNGRSVLGSQEVPSLGFSSRTISRPTIKHVRFDISAKTQRDNAKPLISPCTSSQTKRSLLQTPSKDPMETAKAIRKVLYPLAPETTVTSLYQSVIL